MACGTPVLASDIPGNPEVVQSRDAGRIRPAVIIAREALALVRLATIEKLHLRALTVLASDDRGESRAVVQDLLKLAHRNPRLARARSALQSHTDDIIDGADMIKLAERELMSPLDQEARRLVSVAAQRVSVVTAISPRALVDVLFVAAASLRLVRQLALLYGGRPGTLGMIRLMRHAIGHRATTCDVGRKSDSAQSPASSRSGSSPVAP
eukprot:gene39948-biopygen26775